VIGGGAESVRCPREGGETGEERKPESFRRRGSREEKGPDFEKEKALGISRVHQGASIAKHRLGPQVGEKGAAGFCF
jgi:hypothetical protein